jgi:hypothetical protein
MALMSATTNNRQGEPLEATRDEVLDSIDHKVKGRYVFVPDGNRLNFDLLSFKNGFGFAESQNTGCLFLVVQTGHRYNNGVVRAQAIAAVDTGDLAGTLRFDPKANGTVKGTISAAIAEDVQY